MEDQIEQLINRYGGRHDYGLLTEQQTRLLLSRSIKDNTDGCGWTTVEVRGIKEGPEGTLLDLLDVHTYVFRRNSPGTVGYATRRIREFKQVLGMQENPTRLEDAQVFLFELPDQSKVKVEYATIKDQA
ncbi:hypothetical protein COV17_00330 [Candidatus Woesearchaeota archaeon CG10_big_fil_rev_8_21_14_0_10_36_11]|nr:MAG: hypothetical protein COV17_00330 [Candidatus Woesearchaeota archaeon CG10_big_fil_rev_8_21_14_0_10_36_11]